jgi:hypothetical protein
VTISSEQIDWTSSAGFFYTVSANQNYFHLSNFSQAILKVTLHSSDHAESHLSGARFVGQILREVKTRIESVNINGVMGKNNFPFTLFK